MKSDQWKADRNALRALARKGDLFGLQATVLYCLISQMRGKLHMPTYAKHHGGWQYGKGTYGPDWYELRNLSDQKKFLQSRKAAFAPEANQELHDIVERVLSDDYASQQNTVEEAALSA